MAVFRKRRPAPAEEARTFALPGNMWAPPSGFASSAGVPVTLASSLQSAAVWGVQRVLTSTVAMLPVYTVRENDGGRLARIPSPPLVRNPSGRVSRRGWVAQLVRSGLQCGNMYGRIVSVNGNGVVTQVETIDPGTVTWQVVDGAEVPYIDGQPQTLWPAGDFWHVPIAQFLPAGTRVALSPTDAARTGIGTAIAAEDYGARFFGDSGHPVMIARAKTLLTKEQATAIKSSLQAATRGTREPAVLGGDIELSEGFNLKDAQFIDILRFEVEQACRVWGVPPTMVYAAISGQHVTYANVSQSDLQFLKYSVQAWLADLEDAWSDLIAMPHSVRFDTDAVLRLDALTRAQVHEIRLRNRTETVNEARADDGRDPYDDPTYDAPGIPGGTQGGTP